MLIEMKVIGIQIHPETNTPVVWLKDPHRELVLPIWIGVLEATSIATQLEKIEFPRPMTHDLLKNIIQRLGVKIVQVEITDLRDSTYYARILLKSQGYVQVDARPSDAIALALRANVPILVDDKVLNKQVALDEKEGTKTEDEVVETRQKELLERLSPADFSKYKM